MSAARRTIVNTQAELAELLGCARSSVTRWLRKGLPRRADGKFEVAKCAKWLDDNRAKLDGRAGKAGSGMGAAEALEKIADKVGDDAVGDELRKWAVEWRKTRTLQAELKLAEARGDLIPREEVVRLFVLRCTEIRAGLLAMRRRIMPALLRVAPAVGKHRAAIADVLEEHGLALLETFGREHRLLGEGNGQEQKKDKQKRRRA